MTESSESYVNAIHEFSRRIQDEHFVCGVHYKKLAEFLLKPVSSNNSIGLSTASRQNTPSEHSFRAVTVIDLIRKQDHDGRDTILTRECGTPIEYSSGKQVDLECSQLIFLRGFQSADWIKMLGATLLVEPEFWRRHLAFLSREKFYDLPPLPSSTYCNIQLRITTIFNRYKAITRTAVEKARLDASDKSLDHYSALEQARTSGESVIRRLDVHNEVVFTIEQYISCTMVSKNNGWAVLVWLDSGKPLRAKVTDSWTDGHMDKHELAWCLPTIQHIPNTVLGKPETRPRTVNSPASPSGNKSYQRDTTQSAALLPLQYGRDLDVTSMRTAPLYALSNVFRFAAHSSNQYAAFLRLRIDEALRNASRNEALCLDDLRFSKEILDDHLDYLQEIIAFLEIGYGSWILANSSGHGASAGSATSRHDDSDSNSNSNTLDNPMIELTRSTREKFLEDFNCIQRRMQTLKRSCLEGTDIILNGAMLRESQKAIDQAEEVKRLTTIASIYAPLSFACSVCGMQYFPNNATVGVGVFFAILAVSFLLPTAIWFLIRGSTMGRHREWRSQYSRRAAKA